MKNVFFTALMLLATMGYSQKKNNGKVFNEHPAIGIVNSMLEAYFAGDADKVASYLAEDFKAYNGTGINKDNKGNSKEQFIDQANYWKENLSYVSFKPTSGAYPDAIEYKDGGTWVQTWNHLKAMHNTTGVKIDMPTHRLFKLNDDNKIETMINYYNERVFWEIGQSFEDRKNGTIYNHHDNINTVRKMMNAFENMDLETAYSFFKEDARFNSLELPDGETMSLEEVKARKGYIIGFAPENNKCFDYFVKVPDIPEASFILNIIPLQLLAYYLSIYKNINPDKPRNLAKSVTVK